MIRDWERRVERARYEADRAGRQYHACEPENRLVGRTLERRWDEALQAVRKAEEDFDRFLGAVLSGRMYVSCRQAEQPGSGSLNLSLGGPGV